MHVDDRLGRDDLPSPSDLWFSDAGARAPEWRQSVDGSHAEHVVVGAGVMGLATAYWLARRGRQVVVVDVAGLGHGASGRNAGIFLPSAATWEDPTWIEQFVTDENLDVGFRRSGHLALASSDAVLEQMRAEVAARPPSAATIDVLDHARCEEVLGVELGACVVGGRHYAAGGLVHVGGFVTGLAAAAAARGATFIRSSVQGVEPDGRGARLDVQGERLTADTVVVACGAASSDLLPVLGSVVTRRRAHMVATAPTAVRLSYALALDYGTTYWRQLDDGTIVAGGGAEADPSGRADEPDGSNPVIEAAIVDALGRTIPSLHPTRVTRRWTGVMDITEDRRPLVGRMSESGAVWLATGFGGHGLPAAVGVGWALAAAISGDADAVPAVLDPRRFPVVAELERHRVHASTSRSPS